ncbi:MAG TPA: diguanylate cyclase [Luteimonas sp.]
MPRPFRLPRTYWADRSVLAILVGLSAWLSLTLARGPGELSAVWIGNGLLTGWLLCRRTGTWPGYVAVVMAADAGARLMLGDDPGYALAISGINAGEALLVAGIVRSRVPDIRAPRDWTFVGGLATAATLLACALSGVAAAAVAQAVHGQEFRPAFANWYAAHVVGMVIVATSTLVAQREGMGIFRSRGRKGGLALSLALLLVLAVAVFMTPSPVLFLTYPPLLLVALRHEFPGLVLGVILLGLVGAVATALGHGPLWLPDGLDSGGRMALLQLLLAGGCLMTIPVCLANVERRRLSARLAESERRYRLLADHSHDLIARVRADGERVYVSPSATDMLGWSPEQMLGSRWDQVHPEDRSLLQDAMAEVLATGDARTDVYRLLHRDGHYVWVETVARCLPPDEDGGAADLMMTVRNISRRVAAEQALAESRCELERISLTDSLTGLANRRQFDERLAQTLARLARGGGPVSLLYLDIDRFKEINDGHGHAVGDAILQEFARRLLGCVRATDVVARVGGDEFVVLIEGAGPGAAEKVARKVLDAARVPVDVDGLGLVVGTSIGIATASADGVAGAAGAAGAAGKGVVVEPAALMARADAALYAAKRAGRNRYEVDGAGGDAPPPPPSPDPQNPLWERL